MLAPNGALWISAVEGLGRIDPDKSLAIRWYRSITNMNILFDREGDLWLGSYAGRPQLHWLAAADCDSDLTDEELQKRMKLVLPSLSTGVSDNTNYEGNYLVKPLLEDNEGNIWVSTSSGISRYSHKRFTSVPLPLPVGTWNPVAIARGAADSLWVSIPSYPKGLRGRSRVIK